MGQKIRWKTQSAVIKTLQEPFFLFPLRIVAWKTSESDVYRRQILTSRNGFRIGRIKKYNGRRPLT